MNIIKDEIKEVRNKKKKQLTIIYRPSVLSMIKFLSAALWTVLTSVEVSMPMPKPQKRRKK
ncbi:hypothetical protein AAIR98_000896 [Elusimicrobium simillimum]|uniref:hypothetical protein n=1 Tax=Elusimicrobium simillimum TaxID=3143438 RepID=UPI003C6EC793